MNQSKVIGILYVIMIAIALMLTQCKINNDTSISDEEFVDILFDLHIFGVSYRSLQSSDSAYTVYWEQIENKYNRSKEAIEAHYDQLKSDPKRLRETYEQVIENLNDIQGEVHASEFESNR